MKENGFWNSIRKALTEVHWQRIETATSQGVPDVNGCCGGDEFWLELKVVTGNKVHLRADQAAWLMRRADAGGTVWIVIRHKDDIKLYDRYQSNDLIMDGMVTVPRVLFEKPYDWQEFLRIIRKR